MAILEGIGKKITDVSQNAASKAKDFSDIAKLNSTVSDREKQIAQLYSQIGASYYESHKADTEAEFSEQVNAINQLAAEIAQCRETIRRIKGVSVCPNCGAEIPAGSFFCKSCGTRAVPEQPKAAETVAPAPGVCPNCGAAVAEGNIFCNNCGTRIG